MYDAVNRVYGIRPRVGEPVRHRITGHDGTVIEATQQTRKGKQGPTVRVEYPIGTVSGITKTIGLNPPGDLLWMDRSVREQVREGGE